jgi:molecular chaperone GrpE
MEEAINKEELTDKSGINPEEGNVLKLDDNAENSKQYTDSNSEDIHRDYEPTSSNDNSGSNKNEDELKQLQEKVMELNDKYLRLYSDFENYRKRIQKEKTDWMKYAGEDVIKHILPVLDDFERAIKHNQNLEDVEKLREGFVLIFNKLKQLLKQKGLEPMESKGEPFNADFMEAVTQIPAPDDQSKGKVIDELEKGYKMHEKIIRLAKVVVGS